MQSIIKEYGEDPQVKILAVQTVFEGFGTNSPEAAKKIVKRYGLEGIPVGQSGSNKARSRIMSGYRTRGTPWTIIMGPDGIVKFNDFRIKPEAAKKMIAALKKEAGAQKKD